ncbi:O-antigen ligase family protein [Providencia alcalifaciens]
MKTIHKLGTQAPFFLLFVMIIGMFTNDTQGILNISTVLLFLFVAYTATTKKINVLSGLSRLIKGRKFLFLFLAWCLFCAAFFTYSGFTADAFKAIFEDWRYILVITLFLIVFQNDQSKSQKVITYALISTLAFILFITPILKIIKGSDMPMYLQLRYGFAHYATLIFPFVLTGFFTSKSISFKIILFLLSIIGFIFILYTGSRGGALAIVVESALILLLLSPSLKRFLSYSLIFSLLLSATLYASYSLIPQVKNKVNQTINANNITSSRDQIIDVRYPLIMNSIENNLHGIGYSGVAYNNYLNDHNVKPIKSASGYSEKKKMMTHNNDEPFFLNIAYNIGYIGLFLFCAAFIVNMKDLLRSFKQKKGILNVGIFVSSIGYFLVYCLFEFIFLDIFILYNILTAILINNVLVKK